MTTVQNSFLFLFTGDEFLRRKKVESLLTHLVPKPLRFTNLFRVYPEDLRWPDLMVQAKTIPLMGGAQVFWITQVERIKENSWAIFETYCKEPATESYFIFEADELSAGHPLMKLVKQFGAYQHFESKIAQGGFEVLREKLKRSGKTLTQEAWRELEERLGGSLSLMDTCLDQLILYCPHETIDAEVIQQVASNFFRYEVFDLTDALARKDCAQALQIFRYFYDLNGDITSTVGLLHWQIKRIWKAKNILARGGTREEVERILKISPSRLALFLKQVDRFNLETVEQFVKTLWQLDWDAKTGTCDEAVAVETFLASIR